MLVAGHGLLSFIGNDMKYAFGLMTIFAFHAVAGLEGTWEDVAYQARTRAAPKGAAIDELNQDVQSYLSYKFDYQKAQIFYQCYLMNSHSKGPKLVKIPLARGVYTITKKNITDEKETYELEINAEIKNNMQIITLKIVIENNTMIIFENNHYRGTFNRQPSNKAIGFSCLFSILGCKF